MIIRITLLLLVCAFAALSSADLLQVVALPVLPDFITSVGLGLLFCAFLLLLSAGLWVIAKQIWQAIGNYCSASQRGRRRVLFIQTKQRQLKQLFHCRALRINYVHELKRQQLLRLNQRKHLNALSKAIHRDLQALKTHLPKTTFQQYQQQIRNYRQQQNSAALLQLQQKIHHDG